MCLPPLRFCCGRGGRFAREHVRVAIFDPSALASVVIRWWCNIVRGRSLFLAYSTHHSRIWSSYRKVPMSHRTVRHYWLLIDKFMLTPHKNSPTPPQWDEHVPYRSAKLHTVDFRLGLRLALDHCRSHIDYALHLYICQCEWQWPANDDLRSTQCWRTNCKFETNIIVIIVHRYYHL